NSSASTTATGPSIANQVITFYENVSGSVYTPFVTPTTTATFSLSNQQYSMTSAQIATRTGSSFGTNVNSGGSNAGTLNLYMQLGAVGGASASNFTAASGMTAGTGISTTTNYGVEIFNSALALANASRSTSGRWYMADLTITFSTPINNPVIHVAGLGGTS